MKRLSIIVPFYNVEKYIEECIRSLFRQDIPQEEYEVICVDDYSPDHSRDIVQMLQKEYQSLILVTLNENRKSGGARNAGLEKANGEYIWFVDSDDYIAHNCLGTLLQKAEINNLDILHFDYYIDKGNEKVRGCMEYSFEKPEDGIAFLIDESHEKWFERCPVVWRRLHKAEFLRSTNLYFENNVMFEDTDYSFRVFSVAKRVMHINLAAYNYRINLSSITHKKNTGEILFYKISLLNRCAYVYQTIEDFHLKKIIANYIQNEISQLRSEIKKLDFEEKVSYTCRISKVNIYNLTRFCSWRTLLAIKYGLSIFVPC